MGGRDWLWQGSAVTHLDEPCPLPETVQAKLVGDLGGIHGVWQVLLICEDEKESVTELVLVQHTVKLFASLRHTLTIVRIDDENDALRVLEVWTRARKQPR